MPSRVLFALSQAAILRLGLEARGTVPLGDTARAMSQENVEVVRRGFEAFQWGGPEALLEVFDDNVITYRHEPDGATLHGKAGFRDAVADWTEDFGEWQILLQELTDLGEQVLARVLQIARGRSSGIRVEEDWWFLFELTGGKVSKLSFYSNPADALEAARLSE
jgi:ketosteroid isomerase-like protein